MSQPAHHIIGFGQVADLGEAPPPSVVRGGLVMVAVADGHPASRDRVAHHRQVLDHARRGTFLPAAFGLRACPVTAEHLVAERQPALLERLARYAGCVEIVVRVLAGEMPRRDQPPPASGRAFLQNVQARERAAVMRREKAAAAMRRLDGRIAVISEGFGASVRACPAGASEQGRFAIAARRHLAAALADRLTDLAGCPDLAGLHLDITGPWPLYSFTDVGTAP